MLVGNARLPHPDLPLAARGSADERMIADHQIIARPIG